MSKKSVNKKVSNKGNVVNQTSAKKDKSMEIFNGMDIDQELINKMFDEEDLRELEGLKSVLPINEFMSIVSKIINEFAKENGIEVKDLYADKIEKVYNKLSKYLSAKEKEIINSKRNSLSSEEYFNFINNLLEVKVYTSNENQPQAKVENKNVKSEAKVENKKVKQNNQPQAKVENKNVKSEAKVENKVKSEAKVENKNVKSDNNEKLKKVVNVLSKENKDKNKKSKHENGPCTGMFSAIFNKR